MQNDKVYRESEILRKVQENLMIDRKFLGVDEIRKLTWIADILSETPEMKVKQGPCDPIPLTGAGMLARRNQLGMRVSQVEEAAGVSYQAITRIEKDEDVHHSTFLKLLDYYKKRGL